MRGTTGIVDSIDRSTRTARVQALGSASGAALGFPAQRPILYAKYTGDPPPPLSYVDLDQPQPGVWRVQGSASQRRVLLHDDFISAINPASGTGQFGDTTWRLTNLVAYAYGQKTDVGWGVGELVQNSGLAGAQNIAKDDGAFVVTSDPAIWFSANISASVLTNVVVHCGLGAPDNNINYISSAAGDAIVKFVYDTSGASRGALNTQNGVGSTTVTTPFVPTVDTFFDIDIVVSGNSATDPGGFASLWIDGDGPYTSTTNVPVEGLVFEPFFGVVNINTAAHEISVDWIHCETITPIANPVRDLVLPESNIIA